MLCRGIQMATEQEGKGRAEANRIRALAILEERQLERMRAQGEQQTPNSVLFDPKTAGGRVKFIKEISR